MAMEQCSTAVQAVSADHATQSFLPLSGAFGTAATSGGGYWSKTGLRGTVTVMPEGQGWTFTPASITVSGAASNVNFEAFPVGPYSVSARVTDSSGAGITGVLLFLGGGLGTARTALDGRWSAAGLSGDATVTPAEAGFVFTPETVTVSGWSSSIDFTGSPAPIHSAKDSAGPRPMLWDAGQNPGSTGLSRLRRCSRGGYSSPSHSP